MKSLQISLLAFACMLCTRAFSQQITIDGNISPQHLIENHLIQGCVETSNITSPINGSINGFSSFGYFERANSNFPFKNGIVLSTGKASSGGNGVKEKMLHEGDKNWTNDLDLETALGVSNTLNATAIEFDFSSISNQIQFNYILASEEYYGNFPCEISDGFAFLIKEAGTNDPYVNIALIPGTSTPVNTNTIHNGINNQCAASNADYFEGYNLGDTNYNGRTKVMTANASILPNVTYHIKLVIADYLDENYDSAVFIEGNSFNAYVDLGDDITTCADQVTINGDINNPSAIHSWFFNDALIEGENQSTLNVNQSGTYTVKIQIPISNNSCTIEDSINIVLSSTQTAAPISDFELCDDASSDGIELFDLSTKTSDVLKSVPKSNYNVSYHWSHDDASENTNEITTPIQNSLDQSTTIHVRIEDIVNGCMAFSTFNLVVNPLPTITRPTDLIGCADEFENGLTAIDLTQKDEEITNGDSNLKVSYHHTLDDADSGENAISSPYNNSSRNEQLFVRVENSLTGCAVNTTLIIMVLDKPIINTAAHFIDACDPEHNGFADFNLTSITPDVLVGIIGVSTSFHETYEDALSGSNAISNPNNYTNTKQNVQIVFIRVTDDVSGCASVTPVEIHTNLLLTGTHIKDFSVCEIKDGELPQFDLNDMEETIVNKLPDVTIDFYESLEDQAAQINPLNKALPYQPSQLPKTLYITLRSSTCTEISEIELLLNPYVDFPSIGSVTYCDTDQDLLTLIDLSTFSSAIANGEDGYSVYYFATEDDAKNNTNRLPNFYENLTPTVVIYTRTISNPTGCADVKSFEITVLPAPETNAAEDIIICDDDQDGFSIVNLNEKISEIVSDRSNRSITFHTSLENAESGTDAIVNTNSYSAKTQTIFTRVQNTNPGGCHTIEPIEIIVNTLPIIPQISNYKYCEDDSDGYGNFIFKTKDSEILKGQSGKQVSYYLNSNDAETRKNPIDKSKAFKNTSTTQTIHIRVENITDHNCYSTGSFYIEVGSNPKFNAPRDWIVCDDISNDGRNLFDLSYKIREISAGNESLNITFYTTQANAEKAYNPIPLEYENIKNPQLIYARIDNGSICTPITTFNIGLIRAPEANPSKPLEMCSPDGNEKMSFDLTLAEFDILDVRQYDLDIQYYANAEDAESQNNVIKTPKNYTNISNPQTVYVRISNTKTTCYLSIPIEIIVNLPPVFNAIDSVTICANSSKSFDLTELNDQLIDDTSNIDISYYTSQVDALAGENTISIDYTYKTSADRLYIRMENRTSGCFSLHNLKLKVNPLPVANPVPDLEHCDDDFDGFYTFDLSQQTAKVLKDQDPNKFSITYHKNNDDANTGDHALNISYPATDLQTIFVRIKNNTTGCYNITKFKTYVHPRPVVDIPDQVICLNNGPLVVSANTNNLDDTYLWSTDATTPEIEIDMTEIGTYWVTVTSIFNCETTQVFNVIESETATIEVTETIDFSDPNNITVTISGIGNYLYVLNNNPPQDSNVFENVPIGLNVITVIDLNGCAEVTKEVIVIDTPKFMTPNDDGYFDTWHITGVETLPGTVIYIYDRYGKQLAYLTSTSQGWDGTHNGHKMPSSDYWFVAEVKKDNVSFQLKGHFALKR